jgi:hypothetical protein
MEKRTEEWLRQSDYDFETAEAMYASGRHIYAVFMCHLALEKALKGMLYERLREIPPKKPQSGAVVDETGGSTPGRFGKGYHQAQRSEHSNPVSRKPCQGAAGLFG